MGKHIEPAPDTSDERLVELLRWTSKAGMPDVHALLLDLQKRRATQIASADRRYVDDGDGGCSVCGKPYTYHSAVAFTEPQEFRCPAVTQTTDADRVRAVVREAVMDAKWSDRSYYELLNDRSAVAKDIADRVVAQLTLPPPGHVCPVPYALSPEDLDTLSELQSLAELSDWPRARAVIAQILAVHRAPGPRS